MGSPLVAAILAETLGLRETGDRTLEVRIRDFLRDRRAPAPESPPRYAPVGHLSTPAAAADLPTRSSGSCFGTGAGGVADRAVRRTGPHRRGDTRYAA